MNTPIDSGLLAVNFEGYGTYTLSPMSDSVHRFPDHYLDHLHYWDDEDNAYHLLFIGGVALDQLVEFGVPETHRESITEFEHQQFIEFVMINSVDVIKEVEPEDFRT